MKRLTIILLSLVMVLNIPITTVFADHIEENNLNYYSYELFENSEKRYVDVINKKTKHVDYIVYDKKTECSQLMEEIKSVLFMQIILEVHHIIK